MKKEELRKPESIIIEVYDDFNRINNYFEEKVVRDKSGKFSYAEGQRKLHNKNDVADLVEAYRKDGRMKKCVNLKITENRSGTQFFPICAESALNWYQANDTTRVLIGCPNKCYYYYPTWKQKLKKFRKTIMDALAKYMSIIWRCYDSQPPLVKTIVVLIILFWIIPKTLLQIIYLYHYI